jgi:hypothetical protein
MVFHFFPDFFYVSWPKSSFHDFSQVSLQVAYLMES